MEQNSFSNDLITQDHVLLSMTFEQIKDLAWSNLLSEIGAYAECLRVNSDISGDPLSSLQRLRMIENLEEDSKWVSRILANDIEAIKCWYPNHLFYNDGKFYTI